MILLQVTSDDRETMGNLLPLLQDISDNHPESSVQEMASDLRIAIATHGAVWSEVMSSNAEDFKELKSKVFIFTNFTILVGRYHSNALTFVKRRLIE